MKSKRIINVFVGYQINSEYHNLKKLKSAMEKLKKKIHSKADFEISIKYGEFHAGKLLFREVLQAISDCDIAIFDISENNTNVCIEVGMAYGINKSVICLKNQISMQKYPVPADVRAFIYITYNDKKFTTIDSISTINQLYNAIDEYYYSQFDRSEKCFHSLWGFKRNDLVYIVCPELDEPEKLQKPEPGEFLYLSKYGDIDALLMVIKSLVKLFPQIKPVWCTGNEFENLHDNPFEQNLILIGGPDYNKITRIFMSESNFRFGWRKEETILINKNTKKEHKPSTKTSEGVVTGTDYGFFLKKINPKNRNKKLIMINGIHTYAVFGAAKCFLDESEDIAVQNCNLITKKLGDDPNFEILLEVHSENTKIDTPQIRASDILPVYNKH